jgi:hypothetical protein
MSQEIEHTVRRGECINSIAAKYGFFWETIWNHGPNGGLKDSRPNADHLYPGDVLVIPALREKQESRSTEQKHRFRRKGVPIELVLRILKDPAEHRVIALEPEENDAGNYDDAPKVIEEEADPEPEANEAYELVIDRQTFTGSTDGDGVLKASIPPTARRGRLTLRKGQDDERVLVLKLGDMDPPDEPAGAAKRLMNLGYRCRPDDELSSGLRAAIRSFQTDHGIDETGELDDKTRDALVEAHGS